MRLGRDHHAALDAIEAADRPLAIAEVAGRAGFGVARGESLLRFLETHGYVTVDRSGRVIHYDRAERGRAE